MDILFSAKQGDSLTIGFTFPLSYDLNNIQLIEVFLGSKKYDHTITDNVVACQLSSDDTAVLFGKLKLSFLLDDAVFGVKKHDDFGFIDIKTALAQTHNTSLNTGFDVMLVLSIVDGTISVDSVLYDYFKGAQGDSAYTVAVDDGFVGTEEEWLLSLVGNGIESITLISTVGLVKTYRILYTDATTFDYEVTDGQNGADGDTFFELESGATTEHPRWDDSTEPLIYGVDAFNFNALPSGYRYEDGSYSELGYSIVLRSSQSGLCRYISDSNNVVDNTLSGGSFPNALGGSIRLVRLATTEELLYSDGQIIDYAFTDIDGNKYNGVKIGTQVWTNENYLCTKLANGDAIPTGFSDLDWSNLTTKAYATPSENGYGLLYNFYAISGLIVDDNWSVPTDADFTALTAYIDSLPVWDSTNVGKALKSVRQVNSPFISDLLKPVAPNFINGLFVKNLPVQDLSGLQPKGSYSTDIHSNFSILQAIQESLTTTLKTAYDGAVSWISTNGTNILNHISDTTLVHLNAIAQNITGVKTFLTGLISQYVQLSTTPTYPSNTGVIFYNANERTASVVLDDGGTLELGKEFFDHYTVLQAGGIVNGDIVSIVGASGNRSAVALTDVTSDSLSLATIGMCTVASVANNNIGRITTKGHVHELDTSLFTEGLPVYVHPTNIGKLTQTAPPKGSRTIQVGIVVVSHATQGVIDINPKVCERIGELCDVDLSESKTTPIDADNVLLQDSEDGSIWKKFSIANLIKKVIGYLSNITLEPTGFRYPELTVVTANGDRTVTLTGTVEAYWRGVVVPTLVSGYTSAAHGTDTSKLYFLSYDGTSIAWSETVWTFEKLQIAIAKYDAVAGVWFYFRECHGLMSWQTHEELHRNIGTYKSAGGLIVNYVLNSTVAAERRFDIDATTINDEDLTTVLPSLASKLYNQFRLNGADVATHTVDAADIISLSTNNPYYNQLTGGLWQQTLLPANTVATVWLYALPVSSDAVSQKYRYLFVQPQSYTQASNSSAGSITTAVTTERNKLSSELNLNGLISTEIVAIAKVLIVYTGGNWSLREVNYISGSKFAQLGSASTAAVTLNAAYLNSADPEIETTIGALTLKNGTADNTANVLEVKDFSGVLKSSINGNGGYTSIAEYGAEEAPTVYDSGNWTLTSGWAFDGSALDKNAAGTTAATAIGGTAPVAQQVYQITFTVAASIGSGTFVGNVTPSFGGTAFSAITAVGTYTYQVHAVSTARLVFTPSTTTARFSISNISIKKRVDTIGDMTVGGDVYFMGNRILNKNTNTPIFYWYPSGATYVVGTFSANSSITGSSSITGRQLCTTTGTSSSTSGAITMTLSSNGNYYLSAALTGTITVTTSSPVVGAKSHLMFTQGTTAQSVIFAQSGVTFKQTGTNNTGVASITLQNVSSANAFYTVELNWASTTVCFITVSQPVFIYEPIALSNNGAGATDIVAEVKLTETVKFTETWYDLAASLATAATGQAFRVDIKKNGTSIFSTLLSIDASETTSVTAATPYVFVTAPTVWAVGDIREYSVTQVGSVVAGKGLVLTVKKTN